MHVHVGFCKLTSTYLLYCFIYCIFIISHDLKRVQTPLLSPLQAGALDLLKELRSVPMTLELLQVSLRISS